MRVSARRNSEHPPHCDAALLGWIGTLLLFIMATSKIGIVRGTTIELEGAVPEMDGQRVHVVLEAVEEPRLSAERQRELWQAWVDRGPQGPIDDGGDTEFPSRS